jgi:predicted transcriptional regulator
MLLLVIKKILDHHIAVNVMDAGMIVRIITNDVDARVGVDYSAPCGGNQR